MRPRREDGYWLSLGGRRSLGGTVRGGGHTGCYEASAGLGGWLWYRVETLVAPENSVMTSSMVFVPDAVGRSDWEGPLHPV